MHTLPRGIAIAFVCFASVAACAVVTGCATMIPPKPEYQPDGSFLLKCGTSLSRCLDRAEEVCLGSRFTVLAAVDQRDYRGGQGMEESETRSSRAVVKCGSRAKAWFGASEDPLPTPATLGKPAAPKPNPVVHVCLPGATQACTGAAACAGGQACLPDGSGFLPCDCGGATVGAATAPTTVAPGATTPATPLPATPATAPPASAPSAPSTTW